MRIDIVSDVVCPWCYVGKRQLEQAIEQFKQAQPEQAIEVHWHPFQLNPQMPPQGMNRADYLANKFGSADPEPIYAHVTLAAQQVDLNLPISGITKQPNTAFSHSLVAQAKHAEQENQIVELLFKGYFIDHLDFTQESVLCELARQADYTAEQITEASSQAQLAAVRERDSAVRAQGITGVPFFVVNQASAVSGAVGASALLDLMTQVRSAT